MKRSIVLLTIFIMLFGLNNSIAEKTLKLESEEHMPNIPVISVNGEKYNLKDAQLWNDAITVNKLLNGTENIIDCNALPDNSITVFNPNATLRNGPSNFPELSSSAWEIITITVFLQDNTPYRIQMIRNAYSLTSRYATRDRLGNNDWSSWIIKYVDNNSIGVINTMHFQESIDCNTLEPNTFQLFNVTAELINGPDFDALSDTTTWVIETYRSKYGSMEIKYQVIRNLTDSSKGYATRQCNDGTWLPWTVKPRSSAKEIHVGQGQTYTRLRDGIAAGVNTGNATVYVHPGTYDLIEEFAEEIETATGDVGLALGNDIHVIFFDGAKVTALFDNSEHTYDQETWSWIETWFQPFYSILQDNNNFILENVNLEAWNCRYAIHDDVQGRYNGIHKFINCHVKFKQTRNPSVFSQCIGGGLGRHTTIVIEGGSYTTVWEGVQSETHPSVSYHSAIGLYGDEESSITIKDVYLGGNCRFRFGYYGTTANKSKVYICGCNMGDSILKMPETSDSIVDNFEIVEWNNIIRNQ